jgi:hypothetical protein
MGIHPVKIVKNKSEILSEFFKEIDLYEEDHDTDVNPPFDDFEYPTGKVITPEQLMPSAIYGSDTLQQALKICAENLLIYSQEKLIHVQQQYHQWN